MTSYTIPDPFRIPLACIMKKTVWAYKNSAKIDIGSYQQCAIDLGDIQKHNSISDAEPTTGGTAEGVLIHELVEQFELQKSGVGPNDKAAKDARFNDDHQAGINAQNQVNGNTRLREKEQISEGNRVDFLHNNPYYYKYYRQKDNTILEERISAESKDMQINKKVIPE